MFNSDITMRLNITMMLTFYCYIHDNVCHFTVHDIAIQVDYILYNVVDRLS